MPESVWDYPRPPVVEPTLRRIRMVFEGRTIVDTTNAVRVLETSHPPTYYVAKDEFRGVEFVPSRRTTFCEFKGAATYWSLSTGDRIAPDAAWEYRDPTPGFEALRGRVAIYAHAVDECWVDDERVAAQEGSFYGGWITQDVTGPFKGGPGTAGW